MNNKLNDLIVISQKDIVGSINLLYDVKNYFSPNVQYIIVLLGYENENLIKLVSNIARVYYNKNMLDNICIIDIMCDSNNYIFNCYTGIPEINNTDVKYIRHLERKSINGKSIIYDEYDMLNKLCVYISHYSDSNYRVFFPYTKLALKSMSIEDIISTEYEFYNYSILEFMYPFISKIWSTMYIDRCIKTITNSYRWDTAICDEFIKLIRDNYTPYEYILFDIKEPLASLTRLIESVALIPKKDTIIKVIPYDANTINDINPLIEYIKEYYEYDNLELMDIYTKNLDIYDILSDLDLKNKYRIVIPYTSRYGFTYVKNSYFNHDITRLESIYNITVPNRNIHSEFCTINIYYNKRCLIELLKKYKYIDNSIIKSIKKSIESALVVDGEILSDEVKEHVKDLYDIFKEDEKEDTDKKSYCKIGGAKLINRLDKEFNKIENSDDTIISKEDYKRIVNSLKDKEDDVKPAKVSVHIENNDKQTENDTLQNNYLLQLVKEEGEKLLNLYELICKELSKEESDK